MQHNKNTMIACLFCLPHCRRAETAQRETRAGARDETAGTEIKIVTSAFRFSYEFEIAR